MDKRISDCTELERRDIFLQVIVIYLQDVLGRPPKKGEVKSQSPGKLGKRLQLLIANGVISRNTVIPERFEGMWFVAFYAKIRKVGILRPPEKLPVVIISDDYGNRQWALEEHLFRFLLQGI